MAIDGPPMPDTLLPKQLERRNKIIRAGVRALANTDYADIKVADVARDSGVALGTVYRYFVSKEHLFAAVFAEWQGALRSKLDGVAPLDGSEADRLREVFRRGIQAFQRQPRFVGVMMMLQSTTDPYAAEIYDSLRDLFDDMAQSAVDGPADVDRRAIYRTISAVLDSSLRAWTMNHLTIRDVYEQVDDAIRLIYEFSATG